MSDAVSFLPLLNASLNACSVVCLWKGFKAIRAQQKNQHEIWMKRAVWVSALFLAFYLLRVWLTGTHVFPKEGFLKYLYLVILFSHMLLAVCVVPMVFRALFLARKERFEEHRVLARWLWPVWMYVGVTGVLVYVLLYHAAYWF